MSAVANCCSPCPTVPPVQVPGLEGVPGTPGTNGTNGGNAYTTTTSDFVVPALTASVTVAVASTSFMAIGQYLFIPGGGIFQVATIFNSQSVSLTYINDPQNTNVGNTVANGSAVTPTGKGGTNGTSGNDGFTQTFSNTNPTFITPAVGATAEIEVLDTSWMVAGQYVAIDGSGIYQVQSVDSGTSFTGLYPNFTVNVNSGTGVNSGTKVVLSIPGVIAPISFYASGSAYSVATTTTHPDANVAIGGVNTAITITTPGTWLIFARARYDGSANPTFSASNLTATRLRRTNNTAADLVPTVGFLSPAAGFSSASTYAIEKLAPIIYVTANNNDVIELWALSAAVTTNGTLTAVEAEIVAIFLHP